MKASMDEKLHLIMELKTSIENMRGIIDGANVWCSIITVGGVRYDYIWDILNSGVTDKIAEGVINNGTVYEKISIHHGRVILSFTVCICTASDLR